MGLGIFAGMEQLKLSGGLFSQLNTNIVVLPSYNNHQQVWDYIDRSMRNYCDAVNDALVQSETLSQWLHLLPELDSK